MFYCLKINITNNFEKSIRMQNREMLINTATFYNNNIFNEKSWIQTHSKNTVWHLINVTKVNEI